MSIQNKVCSFFGHRKIKITEELKQNIKEIVKDLIVNYNMKTFLFGSRNDFNYLCHCVVSELKEKYPFIKRIAYTCKSETCILESERKKWEKIYSNFHNKEVHLLGVEEEFEHKSKFTSNRASYVERNQAMINDSNYCVFITTKVINQKCENTQIEVLDFINLKAEQHSPIFMLNKRKKS